MDNLAAGPPDPGRLSGMTFAHLPRTVDHLPLDDPRSAADVVDLVVSEVDRTDGCLCLLLLDDGLRLVRPVLIGEVGDDADPADVASGLATVLGAAVPAGGGVVVARGRDGSLLLTDADRRWHEALVAACAAAGARLVGSYLASPSGVRAFPAPLTAATDLAS